ncbi:MAG: hypothetical protein IJ759_04680 [Bacteroidales bacterium]|nr:hypothetical protein [Bacteroidales bacterium]
MEQIYIKKGQFSEFETFMEQVCEKNRLYNYIGAIDIALESVLKIADCDIVMSYSHYKDGICFSVQTDSDKFSSLSFSDTSNNNFESLFLIKNLTDTVNISRDGKVIDLYFSIDGIEEELAVSRKERIKSFSCKRLAIAQ